MPGRKYSIANTNYRYGFNGKENDNDVKGVGGQQDYGMRIYDPRLGRFLSVDPITKTYPELTPYQFSSNRPLDGVDFDGLEWKSVSNFDPKTGITTITLTLKIKVVNHSKVAKNINNVLLAVHEKFPKVFTGYDQETKTKYVANLRYSFAKKVDPKKDFFVEFNDKDEDPQTDKIGNTQINSISFPLSIKDSRGKSIDESRAFFSLTVRAIIHELGHTGGLVHPENDIDDENSPNPANPIKEMIKLFRENKLNLNLMFPSQIIEDKSSKPEKATELLKSQVKFVDDRVKQQQNNPKDAKAINGFTGEDE